MNVTNKLLHSLCYDATSIVSENVDLLDNVIDLVVVFCHHFLSRKKRKTAVFLRWRMRWWLVLIPLRRRKDAYRRWKLAPLSIVVQGGSLLRTGRV